MICDSRPPFSLFFSFSFLCPRRVSSFVLLLTGKIKWIMVGVYLHSLSKDLQTPCWPSGTSAVCSSRFLFLSFFLFFLTMGVVSIWIIPTKIPRKGMWMVSAHIFDDKVGVLQKVLAIHTYPPFENAASCSINLFNFPEQRPWYMCFRPPIPSVRSALIDSTDSNAFVWKVFSITIVFFLNRSPATKWMHTRRLPREMASIDCWLFFRFLSLLAYLGLFHNNLPVVLHHHWNARRSLVEDVLETLGEILTTSNLTLEMWSHNLTRGVFSRVHSTSSVVQW